MPCERRKTRWRRVTRTPRRRSSPPTTRSKPWEATRWSDGYRTYSPASGSRGRRGTGRARRSAAGGRCASHSPGFSCPRRVTRKTRASPAASSSWTNRRTTWTRRPRSGSRGGSGRTPGRCCSCRTTRRS